MKTSIKNFLSFAALGIFFAAAVASSVAHATYGDAAKWIPKDFNPNDGVLLIQMHPLKEKQKQKMQQWLEQNYTYSFEIANEVDINNKEGKYADTKKYPFAVLWRSGEDVAYTAGSGQHFSWRMYGYFVDRSTDKAYPSTSWANAYGQSGYIPFFNSVLKKYKK
jgi:hypothetical protein